MKIFEDKIPSETQVGGNHYKKFEYQPVHFLMDINCNTALGYAIKYISRYPNKNPDDLDKAVHCLKLYEEWVIKKYDDEDYVVEQAILDFLKIHKFTSQFEPKVSSAIQNILSLSSVLTFVDEETGILDTLYFISKVNNAINLLRGLTNEN